jgi:hypothetical protein
VKFRKRPIVIEAVKVLLNEWADNPYTFEELPEWLDEAIKSDKIVADFRSEDYWYLLIHTLEGVMTATPDDWIIRGVQGELYPVQVRHLQATYERVDE